MNYSIACPSERPFEEHVVLVDNSDVQNTTAAGAWATASTGGDFSGYDYATHSAGSTATRSLERYVPVPP